MISTTSRNNENKPEGPHAKAVAAGAAVFWIAVWALAAKAIGSDIVLVSPARVAFRLCEMAGTGEFWLSVAASLLHIALGCLSSVAAGILLAVLAHRRKSIEILLSPLVKTVKTIPVASFIILLLIWIPSRRLSTAVSFLMCFPIIYTNIKDGLEATDPQLLEMADLFGIRGRKRFVAIYLSELWPFFHSALSLALGLAWKSGIAAEVIGLPDGTIGAALYEAKAYLETADLFAWTVTIALVAVLCEKIVLSLLSHVARRLEVNA